MAKTATKGLKIARTTDSYNNYDPQLPSRRLERGEKVVFQSLRVKRNRDPREERQWNIPPSQAVRPTDRIYDPYQDRYVDIAAIKGIKVLNQQDGSVKEQIEFMDIVFRRELNGCIILDGNKSSDQELFEYLWLSNYNISNPNRDKSVEPRYMFVDPASKAKDDVASIEDRLKAMNMANEMEDEELRSYCASLGMNYDDDYNVLKKAAIDHASLNPKNFMEVAGRDSTKIKAQIARAEQNNIIKFDGRSHVFKWADNNEEILKVARSSDKINSFLHFVISTENGDKVFKEIEERLKKS